METTIQSATQLFVFSSKIIKTKSQHCSCSNPPWQNTGEEPLPNALVGLLTKRELHHCWCYDSSKHPHPIDIHWYECTQLQLHNVRPGDHPAGLWQPTLEIVDGFLDIKGIDVEKELSCYELPEGTNYITKFQDQCYGENVTCLDW